MPDVGVPAVEEPSSPFYRWVFPAHLSALTEQASPANRAMPANPGHNCYLVVGNHDSYSGIGEVLYALLAYFSRHYTTFISRSLVPNATNVIIDEFSRSATVDMIRRLKQSHPETRFVVMATEFITEISVGGTSFGNTFNFFDARDDVKQLTHLLAHKLHIKKLPPYLTSRYRGFVEVLDAIDLVLCAHPAVAETMKLLPASCVQPAQAPLTLYPEVDPAGIAADLRLYQRPPGITMTGTLTGFRQRLAARMIGAFRAVGIDRPVYQYIPFREAPGLRLDETGVDFGYGDVSELQGAQDSARSFLYNMNPPQRANWGYSSPMRILRAMLLGQIPLLTRRFGDHEIEEVASLFDGEPETAEKLWVDATVGRFELIERYLVQVERYSHIARAKNLAIDAALASLK
jgi:hypothetical protein